MRQERLPSVLSFRPSAQARRAISRLGELGLATTEAVNRALEGEAEVLRTLVKEREAAMIPSTPLGRATLLQLLFDAFDAVIRPQRWRPTGSASLGYVGRFEDAEGVHWTVWVDNDGAWLGVTIPGKKFRDWPIATFILQERTDPQLLELIARLPAESPIEMAWWRTVWQGRGRLPKHPEQNLTGDDDSAWIPLRFDRATYEEILEEALKWLDESRGYRGRGSGEVVKSGKKVLVTRGLTPEFQFRVPLRVSTASQADANRAMNDAKRLLQDVYEFVRRRTQL